MYNNIGDDRALEEKNIVNTILCKLSVFIYYEERKAFRLATKCGFVLVTLGLLFSSHRHSRL